VRVSKIGTSESETVMLTGLDIGLELRQETQRFRVTARTVVLTRPLWIDDGTPKLAQRLGLGRLVRLSLSLAPRHR
jgi:hypothetical protein